MLNYITPPHVITFYVTIAIFTVKPTCKHNELRWYLTCTHFYLEGSLLTALMNGNSFIQVLLNLVLYLAAPDIALFLVGGPSESPDCDISTFAFQAIISLIVGGS